MRIVKRSRILETILFCCLSILSLSSMADAMCPTCPPAIKFMLFTFSLTNQTSGNCFYEAAPHLFGFECAYWLTGAIEQPPTSATDQQSSAASLIPFSSPLCPSQVPLTTQACSFYTEGGVNGG